jgi:hypothetical protein
MRQKTVQQELQELQQLELPRELVQQVRRPAQQLEQVQKLEVPRLEPVLQQV